MAAVATAAIFTGSFGAGATLAIDELTESPEGGWPGETGVLRRGDTTYFGYIDSSGNVEVRSVTGGVVSAATTLHAELEVDHHDYPELVMRSDGKLVAAYSKHNGAEVYVRIATNANDATTWGAEFGIDSSLGEGIYTYPRMRMLDAEVNDPIYLFIRANGGSADANDLIMSKSTNGGSTWSAATTLWATDPNGHYFRVSESDGSRLDFFVGTGNMSDEDGDMYHFWYEDGSYYDSAGNDMGSPPFDTGDATLVYEAASGEGLRLPRSIERRADGSVVGLFVAFGETLDYDYWWAEWDGSSWSTEKLASSDASLGGFGGGGTHSGPYVYISLEDSGVNHLHRFQKTQDGWQSRQLTSSGGDHVYPVPVRDGVAPLRVIWLEGSYVADPYAWSWGVNGGW